MTSGGVLKVIALDTLLDMAMQNSPIFLCNDSFVVQEQSKRQLLLAKLVTIRYRLLHFSNPQQLCFFYFLDR